MFEKSIIEKIKGEDRRVIRSIDSYLRGMILDSYESCKKELGKSPTVNLELKRSFSFLKKVKKAMEEQPNHFVTHRWIKEHFDSYPLIQKAFTQYELKMEKQYEAIERLDFLGNLSEVIQLHKPLSSMNKSARLITTTMDGYRLYDCKYGPLLIGSFVSKLSLTDAQRLKENIDKIVLKDCHTLAQSFAQVLHANVCTGYVDTQIPNLRVLHSWLEKENTCYDMNIGLFMPKEQYYEFYNPSIVNVLSEQQLEGHENESETGISYVCYEAFRKLTEKNQKYKKEL